MELKVVQRPIQNQKVTPPNEFEYDGESWCVTDNRYREKDGGLKLWYNWLLDNNIDVVYLYEIKALSQNICAGFDAHGDIQYETDIVYYVRADYKNKLNSNRF